MQHHVAIAFKTNGPTPRVGHRFKELVAVKEAADGSGKQTLTQRYALSTDAGGDSFQAQFPALVEFVGTAPLIVDEVGKWKRFLRAEAGIDGKGVKSLTVNVTETALWSSKRFPKQRKDVASIAQRLGVAQAVEGVADVEKEALQLFEIGGVMRAEPEDGSAKHEEQAAAPGAVESASGASKKASKSSQAATKFTTASKNNAVAT